MQSNGPLRRSAVSEIDRSLVGSFSTPFLAEVERGAIRKFADAIGDADLRYRDVAHARQLGYPDVVAPPTFPTCFRPPVEPAWFAPLDRRRIVAGQVAFDYSAPIVAGMGLICRIEFAGVDDKDGSKGRMELLHQRLHGVAVDGREIFVMTRTTIYRALAQLERKSLE